MARFLKSHFLQDFVLLGNLSDFSHKFAFSGIVFWETIFMGFGKNEFKQSPKLGDTFITIHCFQTLASV